MGNEIIKLFTYFEKVSLIVHFFVAFLPLSLSADTKINIIIGVLTIVTGVLSTLLAWAMWKLTREARRRHGHESESLKS